MKKVLFTGLAMTMLLAAHLKAGFWGFEGARASYFGQVWEADIGEFSESAYMKAVESTISAFEEKTSRRLEPGLHKRAGIKIYTNSGPGLCTPHSLTLSVIEALELRGFKRSNLLIVDSRESNLRESGYIPPLAARNAPHQFGGVPVVALESGKVYNEKWFYESAVPPEFVTVVTRELKGPVAESEAQDVRISMLPASLLIDVDFWINLPMVTDHPALGLNGGLVNATLWSISNRQRFFGSPANAPIAVAEILAIPEFQDSLALTIMTLERYQYIAGPSFNSLYTQSEPTLWLSPDPVVLDAMILGRVNKARLRDGFSGLGDVISMLDYCVNLGLGHGLAQQAKVEKVQP